MGTRRLLLPYNFSEADRKALEFALQTFGHQKGVEVTLFHAYQTLPAIEVQSQEVTDRLQGGMAYLRSKITELEQEFQGVKRRLIDGGFDKGAVKEIFKPRRKDIAGEIVDLHGARKFDCIVLSRRPGRIGKLFTGSVHAKLISALKNVTICLVS
jgi:nucleotide-binding universal stress UspA family protein